MTQFHLFIPIAKVDREARTVSGWATTEKVDKQNEIVDYEASKKAFDDWHGNIREMHEPKAVGKAINVKHNDDSRRIYVTAKISKGAEDTWEKVKDGTLTGFSIGGQTIDKISQIIKDNEETKQVTRITKYKLNELSLVDNPANPEAEFELVKSVGGQLRQTSVIEDNVAKTNGIKKYNGGEYETMALSKKTLTKIGTLVKTLEQIVKEDWEDPNAEVGSAKQTPRQTTEGTEVNEGDRVGKADNQGDWEDPNPEVAGAKKTPRVTTEGKEVNEGARVGKADMDTHPDSDLQTQEEDGSDAAPVTKLYKQNEDGEMEEATEEDAKKFLKADMDTHPDSDLQTQDEDGSDAAPVKKRRMRYYKAEDGKYYDEEGKPKPMSKVEHDDEDEDDTEKAYDEEDEDTEKAYDEEDEDDTEKAYDEEDEDTEKAYDEEDEDEKTTKRHYRKAEHDEDEDEDTEKAYDEDEDEDEEKVSKTVLSELRKISKRLTKIETTPLPRKYHKVEKDGPSGDGDAELIEKATNEVKAATEEARITGRPCSPEIEKKREWLINKSLDSKFGTSDLRKV